MIVILDSTELTGDYRLEGTAFRALFDSSKKLSLVLAVPEVVLREVIAKILGAELISDDFRSEVRGLIQMKLGCVPPPEFRIEFDPFSNGSHEVDGCEEPEADLQNRA